MSDEKNVSKELTDAVNKVLSRRDAVKKAGSIAAGAALAFLGLGMPGISQQKSAIACCGSCSESCSTDCYGGCSTDCYGSCLDNCSNSCYGDCYGTCEGCCGPPTPCGGVCALICEGGCEYHCGDSCTGTSEGGCTIAESY